MDRAVQPGGSGVPQGLDDPLLLTCHIGLRHCASQIGPHYCPRDQTIYIDLNFFRELETRFGAAGDFAEAYVMAHEVSHHVQNITGVMEEVRRLQSEASSQADVNQFSVRLELQADCLAGIWARSAYQADLLDPGDTQEAIEAAEAVGDDRIQESATGTINPESWTHGSSEQRVEWFNTGFNTGDPNACNTFSTPHRPPQAALASFLLWSSSATFLATPFPF